MLATSDRQPTFSIHQNTIRRLILSSISQEKQLDVVLILFTLFAHSMSISIKKNVNTVFIVLLPFITILLSPLHSHFHFLPVRVTIIACDCSSYSSLPKSSYGVSQSKNFYDTNLVFSAARLSLFCSPSFLVTMYVYVSGFILLLAVGFSSYFWREVYLIFQGSNFPGGDFEPSSYL
jgi:hypothetical protein